MWKCHTLPPVMPSRSRHFLAEALCLVCGTHECCWAGHDCHLCSVQHATSLFLYTSYLGMNGTKELDVRSKMGILRFRGQERLMWAGMTGTGRVLGLVQAML